MMKPEWEIRWNFRRDLRVREAADKPEVEMTFSDEMRPAVGDDGRLMSQRV
jgi:hypothetical protein